MSSVRSPRMHLTLALLLIACGPTSLAGQTQRDDGPLIDGAVGMTLMTLQKLPSDQGVGGQPVGVFARVGYFWTAHLATEFEVAAQAEAWDPDYALAYVVRPVAGRGFELRRIQLKHAYSARRWTVSQVFQVRRQRVIQPYFGAGFGRESQTVTESRHETTPYIADTLPPNATTLDGLPAESAGSSKAHAAIGFGQVGMKVFLGRRAHVTIDWKLQPGERVRAGGGFGVELF